MYSLESSNIMVQFGNDEEREAFNCCVQPLLNEQALNPA